MFFKELAKFFAGFALMHMIFNIFLFYNHILPINFYNLYTITGTINMFAVIVWAFLAVFLFYYAWIKK